MRMWYSVELITIDDHASENHAIFYISSEDGKLEILNHLSYEEGLKTMEALRAEIVEPYEEFRDNEYNSNIHYHELHGYGR